MIKILTAIDEKKLIDYVESEEHFNQYIIGYVSNYGLETDFLTLWGEVDTENKLKGVLMKYYNDMVFYSKDDFDVEGFSSIIMATSFQILAGKSNVLEVFEKYIKFSSKTLTTFCIQEDCVNASSPELINMVKEMKADNLEGVISLYDKIEEFENNETDNRSLRQRIKDGCGRGFYIEVDGEVAAAVQTTAEYSKGAMIVSVSTNPLHRRKGYVSACLERLCTELKIENKRSYLYYYNAEAGRIYKKLGFRELGTWIRYGK